MLDNKFLWVMRASLIAILFFWLTTQCFALIPGRIEGTVTDAQTNKELSSAKVELLNASDSSVVKICITDNSGKYLLEDVAFGKYILRISSLSYQKYLIPNIDITILKPSVKFGNTSLTPEAKELNEVKVYGYKMTGEMLDDKTVYTINDKAASVAQSGLDLLRQVPEIEVDYMTNEVRVSGSTNVMYLVNGKRVEKNYLMQLNPILIAKIEVITNPGVKYDADVDAVVNIILKKDLGYGLSGRINIEIPTSKYYFSYHNAGIDYFVKNLRLYFSGDYGIENWDLDILRERTSISGSEKVNFTQYGRGIDKEKYGGFNYGADWFINDQNVVTVSSYIQPEIPSKVDLNSEISYLSTSINSHVRAKSLADFKYKYSNVSVYYKHNFEKKGHEFSVENIYSCSNFIKDEEYYEQVYDTNMVLTDEFINQRFQIKHNSSNHNSSKTDYTYPFTEKFKLSVGAVVDFTFTDNSYTERVSDFYDKLDYQENRLSAYSNLSWNVGKLSMQSGVRFEASDIDINHSGQTTSHYNCLLPFLSGQYKWGEKQTFRLNYRRSIQRPGINQLSPFNYKDDSYAISIGNPNLNPSYNDKFEFTHRIQIKGPMYVSYKPYISFVSDGIQLLSIGSDTIRKYYQNVSNEFEYGINMSGTVFPVKWLEISPSFTYYERALQALPEYDIPKQYRSSWRVSVTSNINLPKDWTLFFNFRYNAPTISHQTKYVRNYNFVSGFNKKLNKNFNVQLLIMNPFTTEFFFNKTTTNTATLKVKSESSVHFPYIINVRLKYNFNIGKQGKKVEKQTEVETNRGGIM
jgi:hypothetical protein